MTAPRSFDVTDTDQRISEQYGGATLAQIAAERGRPALPAPGPARPTRAEAARRRALLDALDPEPHVRFGFRRKTPTPRTATGRRAGGRNDTADQAA